MTEPAHNLRLGHSIKKRRTELGWERSQLRVEIGERLPRSMSVSDDAISRLEHGLPTRISHNPVVLAAIADALGCHYGSSIPPLAPRSCSSLTS